MHQRVAVGRAAGHDLAGEDGAAARAVLHHQGLAQPGADVLADEAREDIAGAARRIADDPAQRPVREDAVRDALRARRAGQRHGAGPRQKIPSSEHRCRPDLLRCI
ncbi:hypothetical protein ACFQY5_12125 [Paeniroseomonas aquatica]|uniref:hypothetical protein n=1 Tax=Paeniroseomonas aquatica TaxID=373043 RepID=UPI00361CEA14